MCSSVLCAFSPNPQIIMCRIFLYIFKSNSIFINSLINTTWASSPQIQSLPLPFPVPVVNCCPVRLFFTPFLCFIQYFSLFLTFHPVFRLFSTVYDRTTVRTPDVSYVPYEIFQKFKFNITYCTYMFMPDFYAQFTVRPLTSVTYRTRYFSQTVSQKRPISRNSITFDPDRILGF